MSVFHSGALRPPAVAASFLYLSDLSLGSSSKVCGPVPQTPPCRHLPAARPMIALYLLHPSAGGRERVGFVLVICLRQTVPTSLYIT